MDGPGAYKEDFDTDDDNVENDDVELRVTITDDGGGNEEDNAEDSLIILIPFKGAFPWSALALPCFSVAWSFIHISHLSIIFMSSIMKNFIDISYLPCHICHRRCPGS